MILNTYHTKHRLQYSAHSTASVSVWNGGVTGCTLEDVCAKLDILQTCCEAILASVINNSGDIFSLRKEADKAKLDIRLLIASIERTKKGRL